MESPTLQQLMKQYALTEASCKTPISEAHLELISSSCCEQWYSLPSHLGVKNIIARDIKRSQKDEREKRHDFLLKWKEIKGSCATYKQLITALLKINCGQEAETVCEVLKESASPSPAMKPLTPIVTPSSKVAGNNLPAAKQDPSSSMASMDPDTFEDLKLQLNTDLEIIIRQYSSYVSCIRESLQAKGVTARDLCSDLLTMSAFSHTHQKLMLLSAHKAELEKAVDLNAIFDLLVTEHSSFFSYDIFRFILEKYDKKYQIHTGQDELKYPDHLNTYLERHKVSEFVEINPLLKKYTVTSTELVLKIDIESTSRLTKIKKLKTAVAKILGLKSTALHLLDITDGCVVATFLIPTHVAQVIFNEHTVVTEQQKEQFRALPVLRLECNNCILFDFTEEDLTKDTPSDEKTVSRLNKYNFIREPDDDLKCTICSDMAADPMQHVECGKLFCRMCLEKHCENKKCPHCRTAGATSAFYPDTRSKRAIQKLGVKCTHVDRGCKWEGTVATLDEHAASCTYQSAAQLQTPEPNKQCYVFIDDSNLWVPGKKSGGKLLVDADTDNRFRVDHGRFLNLVTKNLITSKAILYGSIPPPNDTVWKAAREKNLVVKVFKRSGSGRVKEIHAAMARDIITTLHTEDKENVIYIIVTGDRNLKTIIEDTLDKGVPVELWSWENALAREFRQLANTHDLFTANYLDSLTDKFSFTAYMSNRERKDIDPAHAIVYRGVPADNSFRDILANHIQRLLRLFYITSAESQSEGKKDYIIEFPKSNPEVILKEVRQLQKFRDFEYQPCSYPEYTMGLKEIRQPIQITNRFEVFIDSDYESMPDSETYMDGMVAPWQSTEYETDVSDTFDIIEWTTEVRRKPGKMTQVKKRRETRCEKGDHCPKAGDCPLRHTDEESKLFEKLPHIKFQYFKAKECTKKDLHITAEQKKGCSFAHDSEDSWCLGCKMYGHLTANCQVQKFKPSSS